MALSITVQSPVVPVLLLSYAYFFSYGERTSCDLK